jgi:hypothetical protein
MWKVLGGWYSRRVVNVNVNIVAAGFFALVPTLIAVHLAELWLAHPTKIGMRLAAHHKLVISAVTLGVDVVSDVCFYYGLHFLANHWPKAMQFKLAHDREHTHVPFFKDATLVQFQRMILSPLLYTIWLGTQQFLMQAFDISSVWATGIGCVIAVGTIRCIHTWWMIKAEAKKRLAQGAKFLQDLAPHSRLHLHPHKDGPAKAEKSADSPSSNGTAAQRAADKTGANRPRTEG